MYVSCFIFGIIMLIISYYDKKSECLINFNYMGIINIFTSVLYINIMMLNVSNSIFLKCLFVFIVLLSISNVMFIALKLGEISTRVDVNKKIRK